MRFVLKAAWLLALLFSVSSVLAAEDAANSHEQAAREFYEMTTGKDMVRLVGDSIAAQLTSNPEMAPYRDVLLSWMRKIFAGDAFNGEVVRLYIASFSESELRELIAFYRSPIGQKALEKMPELMQKGMAIGQKLAQDNMPELQAAIAARKRELDKAQKKP